MKKAFDCIAFRRVASARVSRRVRGMTRAEELKYWAREGARVERDFTARPSRTKGKGKGKRRGGA